MLPQALLLQALAILALLFLALPVAMLPMARPFKAGLPEAVHLRVQLMHSSLL